MDIDLERVKQLTFDKIEMDKKPIPLKRTILLAAALIALSSLVLLGAARIFDWKVFVNGEFQQGYFGQPIIVGDGFAAMSPEKPGSDAGEMIITNYPDSTPNREAGPGEMSLFGYKSDDGAAMCWLIGGARPDDRLDLIYSRQLAQNAEAPISWPTAITDDYTVLENCTQFYNKKEQLKDAKLLYSYFGEWKNEQLFSMPEGYERYIDSMYLRLVSPTGDELTFSSHLAWTDSQVYGSGGNSIIEKLEIDGYNSVVFVSDDGFNQIYAWKKIPKINTIDSLAFGEKDRPQGNLLDKAHREDRVYEWQQYSFTSNTITKQELILLLKSIE